MNIPEIPRKNQLELNSPQELKIYNLIQEVEKFKAGILVTDIIQTLTVARQKMADYVDFLIKEIGYEDAMLYLQAVDDNAEIREIAQTVREAKTLLHEKVSDLGVLSNITEETVKEISDDFQDSLAAIIKRENKSVPLLEVKQRIKEKLMNEFPKQKTGYSVEGIGEDETWENKIVESPQQNIFSEDFSIHFTIKGQAIKDIASKFLEFVCNYGLNYGSFRNFHHAFLPKQMVIDKGFDTSVYTEVIEHFSDNNICWYGVSNKGLEVERRMMLENLKKINGTAFFIGEIKEGVLIEYNLCKELQINTVLIP